MQIKALKEIVDENQDNTVDLSLKQHTYKQNKDSYEEAKLQFKKMKQRQQEARLALKMPANPLIIRQKPQ